MWKTNLTLVYERLVGLVRDPSIQKYFSSYPAICCTLFPLTYKLRNVSLDT